MSRRRALMALCFVVVAAAVGLSAWRPWQKPKPIQVDAPDLDILHPDRIVTLLVINSAGEPCTVTITGHEGGKLGRTFLPSLPAGEARSCRVPGPYVLEAVTVERGGNKHRRELNATIPGGESRRITIRADHTVEVGPAAE